MIVQLHKASGLPADLDGKFVFWAWKRGSHSGTTLKTQVAGRVAAWDDSSINVQCTMLRAKKGAAGYQNKELSLTLREVRQRRHLQPSC